MFTLLLLLLLCLLLALLLFITGDMAVVGPPVCKPAAITGVVVPSNSMGGAPLRPDPDPDPDDGDNNDNEDEDDGDVMAKQTASSLSFSGMLWESVGRFRIFNRFCSSIFCLARSSISASCSRSHFVRCKTHLSALSSIVKLDVFLRSSSLSGNSCFNTS